MTFKDDFPSLDWDVLGSGNVRGFTEEKIQKNCLDKAVIRSRVEKWVARLKSGDGDWKKFYTENYMELLSILECATTADVSLHKDLKHLVRINTESKVLKRNESTNKN